MTLDLIDYLSLLAIILIGIPHGALDLNLAIAGSAARPKKQRVIFIVYVMVAVISFIAWYLAPSLSLLAFLLLSTVHFGRANPLVLDYKNKNLAELVSAVTFQGGLTTIFLPWLYWNEIKVIFNLLGATSNLFEPIGIFGIIVWFLSAAFTLVSQRNIGLILTTFCLLGLVYFKESFTPLSLFAAFFCVLHSLPHYLKAFKEIERPLLRPPLGFFINTVMAWLLVVIISLFFFQNQSVSSATLSAIFSVLFALTIPHMILVDGLLPRKLENWRIT